MNYDFLGFVLFVMIGVGFLVYEGDSVKRDYQNCKIIAKDGSDTNKHALVYNGQYEKFKLTFARVYPDLTLECDNIQLTGSEASVLRKSLSNNK